MTFASQIPSHLIYVKSLDTLTVSYALCLLAEISWQMLLVLFFSSFLIFLVRGGRNSTQKEVMEKS